MKRKTETKIEKDYTKREANPQKDGIRLQIAALIMTTVALWAAVK